MFPEWGFADTLAQYSGVNARNRHRRADREPVRGDAEPPLDGRLHRRGRHVRRLPEPRGARSSGLLWPAWVWFSVMGTGNHYWLDVVAGVVIAILAGAVLFRGAVFSRWRSTVAP